MTDPAVRPWSRWLRPSLSHVPASLLISLVILTVAAWWMTIYQATSMDMPMGIAVRGGVGGDAMTGMNMGDMAGMDMSGMAGMAMSGMASGWSLTNALVFVAVWTVMMAAMMLPAAASMIFMFAAAQARRERSVAVRLFRSDFALR